MPPLILIVFLRLMRFKLLKISILLTTLFCAGILVFQTLLYDRLPSRERLDIPFQECLHCITADSEDSSFYKNGKHFQFIGGQIDYFRIPEQYWEDRLEKAKAGGLDVIGFYVPGNFHQPDENTFNFHGQRNIKRFLQLIQKYEMLAFVRIGPYICAEWTFGGLPPWLYRKNKDIKIRSSEPEYIDAVWKWFSHLLPLLQLFLQDRGGPIFMVQIENEYASYFTCDRNYIPRLYKMVAQTLGSNVIYVITDGSYTTNAHCNGGLPKEVIRGVNMPPGPNCIEQWKIMNYSKIQQPPVNTEFYTGWIDHWGQPHNTRSTVGILECLEKQLAFSRSASVVMYVYHGGTNFGLWSGANSPPYSAQITSYDYDAPLNEAGDITEKYLKLRTAIFQFKHLPAKKLPSNTSKKAYPPVDVKLVSHLFLHMSKGVSSKEPKLMESLEQYEGYMAYITRLPITGNRVNKLILGYLADYAHVFTFQKKYYKYHGSISRNMKTQSLTLRRVGKKATLIILVENGGYVNYGELMMHDRKGISGDIFLDNVRLQNWSMYSLCLNRDGLNCPTNFSLDGIFKMEIAIRSDILAWPKSGRIYRGIMTIDRKEDIRDTFIHPIGFTRGLIYINRILLGRYNEKGPQLNLYVPKYFINFGDNIIVIVEMTEVVGEPIIEFQNQQVWLEAKEMT
ncbi:unnamed protein product [Calicophoron daubneyi]|uniref:Beta-galactosidase n=1 Tax=Calicophoron daubneyi TaxID=300641 RepID=A0AAV2TK51_CALDB